MSVRDRKAALRDAGRGRIRSGGEGSARQADSRKVQENFLARFPPVPGSRVALYTALPGEVDTERIREAYLAAGVSLFYPRAEGDGELRFYPHRRGDGWVRGRFGIPEPLPGPGVEGIREGFDLIVVPGVAFDASGRRLGQGLGYYDRFLSGPGGRAKAVGLAYSWQIVPEVPVDPWDVPVDAVVTEKGVLEAAGGEPLRT